jgi:topoisomerase-4 subunit A
VPLPASLIESIVKANEKGKIKVRTSRTTPPRRWRSSCHLAAGVSPDNTIDALYAFTDCEMSIAPNACVIENDKPRFVSVGDLLRDQHEEHPGELLKRELEIRLEELEQQWHFSSLEKIFIEKRVYRKIEEAESWEEVIDFIKKGLKPHLKELRRRSLTRISCASPRSRSSASRSTTASRPTSTSRISSRRSRK